MILYHVNATSYWDHLRQLISFHTDIISWIDMCRCDVMTVWCDIISFWSEVPQSYPTLLYSHNLFTAIIYCWHRINSILYRLYWCFIMLIPYDITLLSIMIISNDIILIPFIDIVAYIIRIPYHTDIIAYRHQLPDIRQILVIAYRIIILKP